MNKAMFFSKAVQSGKSFWLMLFSLICAFMMAGCASDDDLGEITGKYGKLTGETDTQIIISKTSNGYSMTCKYYEYSEETGDETDITWQGTFQNVPSDAVKDSNGKEIGNISFSPGEVTFKTTTQRPGTYKAYKDELADLPRSRNTKR